MERGTEVPGKAKSPSHVVGVGASAGGLEALELLFEKMPAATGMAFVVVQHLSPDFKSVMDELLSRKTSIPIHRVEDSMEVEADQIYLIPPRKDMIISNGRLLLTDKDPKQAVNLPIDNFLRSLAQDAGDRAIGVVLSGTGSDGSRGIREIHECGGLVIAQTPETAKFDGMPNSAKATGAVDLVLPPGEIPAALVKFSKYGLWNSQEATEEADLAAGPMTAAFRLLRDSFGIDFSHYKTNTISRRIDRRLLLNRIDGLEEYVRTLKQDPMELGCLYKDLLIGVTRFFRDAEAFERLEKDVIPELIGQKADGEELRIWVAGCATGEEAYSIAIVVKECLERLNRKLAVKIFASDVHRASADFAGAGAYEDAQLADVDPERIGRHFQPKNGAFHVSQEIRQMVVFAQHNLLKDAPFTKLDMVTCRNLLIYLLPAVQKKVLSFFHFGLNTGGVLFLGPSESPGELSEEFSVVDQHWKIYRKRKTGRIAPDLRLPLPAGEGAARPIERTPARTTSAAAELLELFSGVLDQTLPPSLVVDENGRLLHTIGEAKDYLQFRRGPFSVDVLDLVDSTLKPLLSAAMGRAQAEKTPVAYRGIRIPLGTEERLVDLTVRPFISRRTNAYHALITFADPRPAPVISTSTSDADMKKASQQHLASIEDELRHTKENLQATIEELETSNEELQATNEELVASNEELQSTNEELHSVNEELYSVNAEFQKKITELTELTEDMDNLLESTHVYTLFLDRNLRIRKFTPQIAEVFNLLPQDVGRRIDTFANRIEFPDFAKEVDRVMDSGTLFEQQVRDHARRWYLLRILPYRSKTAFDGIVIALVDITGLKAAEDKVRQKEIQLSTILGSSPHLVSIKDRQGRYQVTDAAFQRIAGCDPLGRTNAEIFAPEVARDLDDLDQQVLVGGKTIESEVVIPLADGPHTYLTMKFPMRDDAGAIVGVSSIKTDVTRLKRAELKAREAVEQRDRFLAVLSHELRNPLGAIVNAAAVLQRKGMAESTRDDALAVLQRQASQMSRLLDDLLEVSRITQDKFHLSKEPVGLDDVIEQATRAARPALEKSRIRLEVEINDDTPAIEGDAVRLQQLVVNLLTNAAKYSSPGGEVRLSTRREGDEAVLRVADSGVGVRGDLLPRIFDLFVQDENSLDRTNAGLGVGLSLVRAIAELHGGSVVAASDGVGKGSVFTVRLPAGSGEPPGRSDGAAALNAPATGGRFAPAIEDGFARRLEGPAPGRVVLVEDNDDSRRILESLLKVEVSEVYAENDGKSGLARIETVRPDIAIVDIGLPELTGYEVAKAVRGKLGEEVYLVALTGYGRESDRRAVKEAGFDEHLVKPLKRTDLDRILGRLRSPDE